MSIKSISSGTPIDFAALRDKSKASNIKSAVTEVGNRMQALDQVDGVDLAHSPGSVDVSDARLPSSSGLGGIVNSIIPEKVTGFAEYTSNGEIQSLYTSSKDLTGTKELQYQRNQDGSQIYSVATATGQTTVRETADGQLFMLESVQPSVDDYNTMASPGFLAPAAAPGQEPVRTLEEVLSKENTDQMKENYKGGVERRSDILKGLTSGDSRGDALHKLGDELFGRWNPFKK